MPTAERRLAQLARKQASLGTEVALVPLYVRPEVAEALEVLQDRLRTDVRLYQDVALLLGRAQRGTHGPLTDLLKALVGIENNQT